MSLSVWFPAFIPSGLLSIGLTYLCLLLYILDYLLAGMELTYHIG